MPSFFDFNEGTETGARLGQDSTPLLGRFRAVPHTNSIRQKQSVGDLFSSFTGGSSGSFGYGGLWRTRSNTSAPEETERDDWDTDAEGLHGVGKVVRAIREVWIKPERHAVGWVLDRWWLRWWVMVGLPAMIVVIWCAIPFPQYPIPDDYDDDPNDADSGRHHHIPGHGEARVRVNFWFFLFVFYSQYVVTALIWITKVFNIYSLNWWPQTLGFPLTVSMIATIAIAAPIPLYYIEETREYLQYNTIWIFWTFLVMALPVAIAFLILLLSERHLSLRQSLSDTQRIFTQSWWTGEDGMEDTIARRNRRHHPDLSGSFDPCDSDNMSLGGSDFRLPLPARPRAGPKTRAREALGLNRIWIPASFMRFIWFCAALLIGLSAYVLGETYAEIYLRTLPHNNIETIFYVYSWVLTIHLLDGLTGWILGGNEGERVGSYPLGWIFKLYFSLTYQTYVRALYARLRSPQQFMLLQLISSSTLIILHPLTMSSWWHWLLAVLGLNTQKYEAYAKFCRRSIFIRTLSENVSMAAFLGQIVVLHYGSNRDVYPYFAFDGDADGGTPIVWDPRPSYPPSGSDSNPGWSSGGSGQVEKLYDFHRTLQLSAVTWACEILAAWVVRRVVRVCYKKDVAAEGWGDLRRWPELLPTSAAVMVHVLQNMVFGIIRIRFRKPGAV